MFCMENLTMDNTDIAFPQSFINETLKCTEASLRNAGVCLPSFSAMSPQQFLALGQEATADIRTKGLGWDVTGFGHGPDEFDRHGLVLFTLLNEPEYAAKWLRAKFHQVTPIHYHPNKKETLEVHLGTMAFMVWDKDARGGFLNTRVNLQRDGGRRHSYLPGEIYTLDQGDSVTLPPHTWHTFWGVHSDVIIRETSTNNDDEGDNVFEEGQPRFNPKIMDEEPYRWLVSDYLNLPWPE